MIKVLFFAQVRELVNTDSLTLDASFENVAALRAHLAAQSDRWALALDEGKLLAAVNQTLVEFTHPLKEGDEVDLEIKSRGIFGLLKDWKLDSQSLKDELRETDG